MNVDLKIYGRTCQGNAYKAGRGLIIHLPEMKISRAASFETMFLPIPQERAAGGFLEVGQWNGSRYEFEGNVAFCLAPDGSVWAKICDSPEELPLVRGENGVSQEDFPGKAESSAGSDSELASRILDEAEEAFTARSMAKERAACGGWKPPATISDYLFWIEDEAMVQEQQSQDHPAEASDRLSYSRALRELADELKGLGFKPSPPPLSRRSPTLQMEAPG